MSPLRGWARLDKATEEERQELALKRQTLDEMIAAARCVSSGKVVRLRRTGCSPPQCDRPIVVLGPVLRGMRNRCDEDGVPVHEWPTTASSREPGKGGDVK